MGKIMELSTSFKTKAEWYDVVNMLEDAGKISRDGCNKLRELIHNSSLPEM